MSVEARAYIVIEPIENNLQIHIAIINVGVLPDDIDELFKPLDRNSYVDFYSGLTERTHMTKKHLDMYGQPMRVADIDDLLPAVKKEKDWLDYGPIFRDLLISVRKHYNRRVKVFIEEY